MIFFVNREKSRSSSRCRARNERGREAIWGFLFFFFFGLFFSICGKETGPKNSAVVVLFLFLFFFFSFRASSRLLFAPLKPTVPCERKRERAISQTPINKHSNQESIVQHLTRGHKKKKEKKQSKRR